MSELLIFPSPLDAHCELQHDMGWSVVGVPALHPSGRPGQKFAIPPGTVNEWGSQFTMTSKGMAFPAQRGRLFLKDGHIPWPFGDAETAAFVPDDFQMIKASVTLPRLVVNGQFLAQDVP